MIDWEEQIICPKCQYNPTGCETGQEEWSFEDGETHTLKCPPCGHIYNIIIERPIEISIGEAAEDDKPEN